jgi:hypothetical protein
MEGIACFNLTRGSARFVYKSSPTLSENIKGYNMKRLFIVCMLLASVSGFSKEVINCQNENYALKIYNKGVTMNAVKYNESFDLFDMKIVDLSKNATIATERALMLYNNINPAELELIGYDLDKSKIKVGIYDHGTKNQAYVARVKNCKPSRIVNGQLRERCRSGDIEFNKCSINGNLSNFNTVKYQLPYNSYNPSEFVIME